MVCVFLPAFVFPDCARRFSFFAFLPKAYKGSRRALEWDVLGVAQDEAAMGGARSAEHVGAENLF